MFSGCVGLLLFVANTHLMTDDHNELEADSLAAVNVSGSPSTVHGLPSASLFKQNPLFDTEGPMLT